MKVEKRRQRVLGMKRTQGKTVASFPLSLFPLIPLFSLVWFAQPQAVAAQEEAVVPAASQEPQEQVQPPQAEENLQLLQKKYRALKASYDEIKEQRQKLTEERGHLMGQIKADLKDRETLVGERDRLLGLVKGLNRKNEAMHLELQEQRPQVKEVTERNEELLAQRDALLSQLEGARGRTKEKKLKLQVIEKLRKLKQVEKELVASQRAYRNLGKESTSLREDLEGVRGRLKLVQQEIVKLVSENDQLQREVNFTPRRVARLAKQHERMVRENADMHYNLGVLFSQRKLYDRASKEFLKVVELRPDDEDAHYNLGVIYAEHVPDRDRALAYFRRYLQLNPRAQEASWVKKYIATWQAWEVEERLQ